MSTQGLEYIIDYKSLESGTYEVDYHLDKEFFGMFPESLVQDGDVDVNVVFKVSMAALQFRFSINGVVDVECDRCLDHFDMPVEGTYEMVAKIGDQTSPEEEYDDYITISRQEGEINLAKHIYEFVVLSMPPQKIHPLDEDGNSTCNPDMLARFYVQENDSDFDLDEYDPNELFDDEDPDFYLDEDTPEDLESADPEQDEDSDDPFQGMEMESIEQKLMRNPNWEKLKSLLNKDINK